MIPRLVTDAFLAREATGESWQRIAQALGRADHTTVLHAYKQAEQRLRHDARLRERVQRLRQRVG